MANSTPSAFTPETCPVKKDTQAMTGLSAEMQRTLRKLKRDLRRCPACEFVENCPTLKAFNSTVDAAILAVNEEWQQAIEEARR